MESNTLKQIETAELAVGHVLSNHIAVYVNGLALRKLYDEKLPGFMFNLTTHGAPHPLNISNSTSHIFNYIRSDSAMEFLAIKQALEISEASPAFIEAYEILNPLVQEVRRLKAVLAEELAAAGQAAAKLAEAKADAIEKALAAVEAEFAQPEPQAQPEPEPPFRGKVRREAVPA